MGLCWGSWSVESVPGKWEGSRLDPGAARGAAAAKGTLGLELLGFGVSGLPPRGRKGVSLGLGPQGQIAGKT